MAQQSKARRKNRTRERTSQKSQPCAPAPPSCIKLLYILWWSRQTGLFFFFCSRHISLSHILSRFLIRSFHALYPNGAVATRYTPRLRSVMKLLMLRRAWDRLSPLLGRIGRIAARKVLYREAALQLVADLDPLGGREGLGAVI